MKKNLCVSAVSCLLMEKKKLGWLCFTLTFFSQLCHFFFLSVRHSFYLLCRQLKVRLSPRSFWQLSSRDFTSCGKTWRAGLPSAPSKCVKPCPVALPAIQYITQMFLHWLINTWTPAFLPLCWSIWPRQHCHTSTIRVTMLKSVVIPWLPMCQFF